jgi:hypothetical protein
MKGNRKEKEEFQKMEKKSRPLVCASVPLSFSLLQTSL